MHCGHLHSFTCLYCNVHQRKTNKTKYFPNFSISIARFWLAIIYHSKHSLISHHVVCNCSHLVCTCSIYFTCKSILFTTEYIIKYCISLVPRGHELSVRLLANILLLQQQFWLLLCWSHAVMKTMLKNVSVSVCAWTVSEKPSPLPVLGSWITAIPYSKHYQVKTFDQCIIIWHQQTVFYLLKLVDICTKAL